MNPQFLPSHHDIIKIFEQLPANELLSYAKEVQQRLIAGEKLDQMKDGNDPDSWVTVADTWIQGRILDHFERSPLRGLYQVLAEETVTTTSTSHDAPYLLVIDPLDGTSPFRKGSNQWGIMIALYSTISTVAAPDKEARQDKFQCYSWNLLSDGSLYTNYSPTTPVNYDSQIASCDTFRIDHCAYGAEDLNVLTVIASEALQIPEQKVRIFTNPTAVVVGYQLLQRKLDALLWVASEKGKRIIPLYDLSFLKALPDAQFVVKLATGREGITLVVVAQSETVATSLVKTAERLPWAHLGDNRPGSLDSIILSLTAQSLLNSSSA